MRLVTLALFVAVLLMPSYGFADGPGDRLVAGYRAAHGSGDRDALRSLVCWDGASGRTREVIEERLFKDLDKPIKSIRFRPLSGGEDFESSGFVPNLKPVGWLVVYYVPPPEDSRFFGSVFIVGEKDGRYMITVEKGAE